MEVVNFIAHKNELSSLLEDSFHGIKVMFGKSGDQFVIGNSSMIVSKYQKATSQLARWASLARFGWTTQRLFRIFLFYRKITHLISEDTEQSEDPAKKG